MLGAAASAQGAMITTSDGQGADASLVAGVDADSNFGSGTLLEVKKTLLRGDTILSMLRFDLSALTAPVLAAELVLTAAGPGDATVNVTGLNDSASGQNWGETAVTWNNAPGRSGAGFDAATTTFLGSIAPLSFPGSGSLATTDLLNFLSSDSDGLVTFLLNSRFSGDGFYASKENADLAPPTLNLTLAEQSATSVPEPGTLALFGLGLLGAGMVARRRPRAPGGRRTTCPGTKPIA